MATVTISLNALLNKEALLNPSTDIIPLWGLARSSTADAATAAAAPSRAALDYCRVQLKGNNGARFEQSTALFIFFSEFLRSQVLTRRDSQEKTVSAEAAAEAFLKNHFVPVDVIVDVEDAADDSTTKKSDAATAAAGTIYPCWGLKAPAGLAAAASSSTFTCAALDGSASSSPLHQTEGFAAAEADGIVADPKEVAHLSADFFYQFDMLSPTYKSATPTGVTVSQHAALLALLKDFKGKQQQQRSAVESASAATEEEGGAAQLIAATGKAISMKIPAQAVWRFDFYEGIPSKKKESDTPSVTHTKPVLALDAEFLGSLLVYLRKLEREQQKAIAKGVHGALDVAALPASIAVPPVQWKDLDRTQKRRVREISALLGLEPLYGYLRTNMGADTASGLVMTMAEEQKEQQEKQKMMEAEARAKKEKAVEESAAASATDPDAAHRAQDRKDTMSLVERTMLIAAIKSSAEEGGESKGKAADPTTAASDAAAPEETQKKSDNDEWVREFKAKVANFSRVDALLEERNRQLKHASSTAATTDDATAAVFVPPHPSVDDDDLEMPMGGACYMCGVSGHTAAECKFNKN